MESSNDWVSGPFIHLKDTLDWCIGIPVMTASFTMGPPLCILRSCAWIFPTKQEHLV